MEKQISYFANDNSLAAPGNGLDPNFAYSSSFEETLRQATAKGVQCTVIRLEEVETSSAFEGYNFRTYRDEVCTVLPAHYHADNMRAEMFI